MKIDIYTLKVRIRTCEPEVLVFTSYEEAVQSAEEYFKSSRLLFESGTFEDNQTFLEWVSDQELGEASIEKHSVTLPAHFSGPKITEMLSWEIKNWDCLINYMAQYISKPYICKMSGRLTVSLVHSPLGTWIHKEWTMLPCGDRFNNSINISGYHEKGREIVESSLKYPFSVAQLMEHLILIEDASRIVSRSKEDPYYTEHLWPTWEWDQKRYREDWVNQNTIMVNEVEGLAEVFHRKNSIVINGTG